MTSAKATGFDVEEGLIDLPGAPRRWIWAFTCSRPECGCRTAIVLSAEGGRELLRERSRAVADAWVGSQHYGQAAASTRGVTAFAIDLDTSELFPPVGDDALDLAGHPERIVTAPSRPKLGRNGSCPCGSGKKHKKCCGAP